MLEGGQLFHLHVDHIDRPVMASDQSGAIVWQARYTPFGGIEQITVNTGELSTQDLRFPGQWFQAETGLHQNWHREYDPTTGRYLQADPLGLVDGASVYGYARQNPAVNIDPLGLSIGGILIPRPITIFLPRIGPIPAPPVLPPVPIIPPIDPMKPWDDHLNDEEKKRKDKEYDQYKYICQTPPAKTGDTCTDLLQRAQWHFRCADLRRAWDRKWKYPGPPNYPNHAAEAAAHDEAGKELMKEYERRCGHLSCAPNSSGPEAFIEMMGIRR